MAQFTVEIPDELLPALAAEYSIVAAAGSTTAANAEEYFAASVVETVRQRAEIYKVGPYYTGPTPPQFNQDGTPYTPPQADEIAPAGDVVTEPAVVVNDTNGGGVA